ncbi:MAG: PAS domain S-box protein, partial [Rhodospirillaceae bacterium]|nr:PAS domain S-box protein [Rhodospirillaceae bacterium]
AWDHAPSPQVAIDGRTHVITEANLAACKLTGYNAEALRGRRFTDLFVSVQTPTAAAFLDGATAPRTLALKHSDGHDIIINLREVTPYDPADSIAHDAVRIIALQRQEESDAVDRLQRLSWAVHAYTQSMSALTHIDDVEGLARRVCQAIVGNGVYVLAWFGQAEHGEGKPIRVLGSAGSAIGYMDSLRLSWSEDLPEGQGPTGSSIRSGQPYIMRDSVTDPTFKLWQGNASTFGIRSSVTVPFKRNYLVGGALVVYANAPDAFGAEELDLFARLGDEIAYVIEAELRRKALAITEAKFERLISTTPTPVIGVGLDSTIQIYNTAAELVFGYSRTEAIGQRLDILIPSESVGQHRNLLRTYGITESASRKMAPAPIRELKGRKRNGETFPIEVIISKIDTADGPLMTAIVRDLTEQKALQKRLVQSEKMEAFGQLAGGIAHDFNNLLGVISGNAELLREKNGIQPHSRSHLDFIESACVHGADLTRRLLVFSRKADPKPTTVDVAAVTREVSAILHYTLNSNIVVKAQITSQSAYVNADAALLQTSLLNLCVNARDAMPQGGTLTLGVERKTARDTAGQDQIVITITDTGTGIPPEILPNIFEPFFTTKPEGKGTGLGLPMVYGFTQQANGRIDVASTPGHGTCFTITLPAAVASGTQPIAVTRAVADLRGVRILYVEDNEDLRDVSAIRLEMLGAHVIAISSPR